MTREQIKYHIERIRSGEDLTEQEMMSFMEMMMQGELEDQYIEDLLLSLKEKGEVVSELVGGAKVLRGYATKLQGLPPTTVDTCGTGGDGLHTFNISTTVALLAAAAGIPIMKHGNRSVSSKAGSADVLEALDIHIDLTPEATVKCLEATNFGFLFAPKYHQGIKNVMAVRKKLKTPTIFNILGPLANPARAQIQLLGVYSQDLIEPMIKTLKALGVERAMVVHGDDGMDEISITGPTHMAELKEGTITMKVITPEEIGLKSGKLEDIQGGEAEENAQIIKSIFDGAEGTSRDVVLANGGAVLYLAGQANSLAEGVQKAKELLDNRAVEQQLKKLQDCTKELRNEVG